MRLKKLILTILILMVFIINVISQDLSNNPINQLREHLKRHYLRTISEKVYLHTDKDVYQLGDTLWFKGYLTKYNHVRSFSGNVLTVAIYNSKNEEILKKHFKIFHGSANGNIEIPKDLDDGDHKLVAYSDYMQNVDSTNLFSKIIRIYENRPPFQIVIKRSSEYYNPGDSVDVQVLVVNKDNQPIEKVPIEVSLIGGKRKFDEISAESGSGGKLNVKLKIPKKELKDQLYVEATSDYLNYNVRGLEKIAIKGSGYHFRFFPEGGYVINGVENRVAFEVYDEYSNLVNIKGFLKDSLGNILDTIKTTYAGIGRFSYKAIQGQKYFIEISEPYEVAHKVELPDGISTGISLRLDYQNTETISIDLNASEDLRGQEIYGVLYSGDQIHWSGMINLRNQNQVIISMKDLSEGICQLTIFTNNFVPIAERLVYIPTEKKLKIQIQSNKDIYRQKDKVNVDIKVTDINGNPVSADLSMAVVDESSIISNNHNHIISYDLFAGEFTEDISDEFLIDKLFEKDNYTDLILMTKGWRRFKWEQIIDSENEESIYNQNKKFIKGTIENFKGKPIKNANVQLFNPIDFKIVNTTTDEDGEFYFDPNDYVSIVDTGLIIISASRKNGESNVNINLDNSYESVLKSYVRNLSEMNRAEGVNNYDSILRSQKIQDYYKDFDKQTILIQEVSVVGKRRVKIEEATRRKVYNEVKMDGNDIGIIQGSGSGGTGFIDVIARMTTNFRIENGKVMFRGYNSLVNQSGALIVVNGISMGDNVHVLDNINSADIKEVKILKNPSAALKYQAGALGGLIEITLKDSKDFKQGEFRSRYKNKINFNGLEFSREFYCPVYSSDEDKLYTYDSRNTLYWNPNLDIDRTGEKRISFHTSDQKMKVKIIIEGMNYYQKAGHSETEFIVY